ncbi:UNVERIFIED_CONTAM: hypothetical protein RMT77_001310 [Armadillidium vulgare]
MFFYLILIGLILTTNALKCYICNNCNKFELSQSRQCDVHSAYCMKLDMITGQIQRRCATHDLCSNPEKNVKTKHKKVNCCNTDNCNSSTKIDTLNWIKILASIFSINAITLTFPY